MKDVPSSTQSTACRAGEVTAPVRITHPFHPQFGHEIDFVERPPAAVEIGMRVQVVPRLFEEIPAIKVYYTVEKPGTTWGKAPPPHQGLRHDSGRA